MGLWCTEQGGARAREIEYVLTSSSRLPNPLMPLSRSGMLPDYLVSGANPLGS
jgi:hypothetical protein